MINRHYLIIIGFVIFMSTLENKVQAELTTYTPLAVISSTGVEFSRDVANADIKAIIAIYQKDTHKYAMRPLSNPSFGPALDADAKLVLMDYGIDPDGTVNCFIMPRYVGKMIISGQQIQGRIPKIRLDRWTKDQTGWRIKESI